MLVIMLSWTSSCCNRSTKLICVCGCVVCHRVVQDAVVLIKDIAEADKAAEQLVHEAYQRGSNDNISCVVLKFKF